MIGIHENGELKTLGVGYTLGTSNGVDYIVEQGTSESWYYRKWNSGVIEAIFYGSVSY